MQAGVSARRPARRRAASATYEAIVEAAERLMAERGSQGVTVSEVAHRAGVNRTTAYQHFRTREQVIAAVLGRLSVEVARVLEADLPLGDRVDQMVRLHLERPEIARLWLFQLLSEVPLPKDESWQRFLGRMSALSASGRTQEGIDAEMLGAILLGATLVWSLIARHGAGGPAGAARSAERFRRELKRLLAFGVLKPEDWPDFVGALAAEGKGAAP